MSTVTETPTPDATTRLPGRLNTPADAGIPFTRLVQVELRKLVDTRAGRWLLIAIGIITAVVVAITMFTGKADSGKNFEDFLNATILPQNFLLPILGVLTVTTEWSQRTGLVTFTLEPRRMRVAWAKLSAAVLTGLAVIVAGAILAALSTLLCQVLRGSNPDWGIGWQIPLGIVVAQLIGLAMGLAFGMLIQNTPGAIVAYLFIPILWSIAASFPWMKSIGEWADTSRTMQPLFEGEMHGMQWAHLAVSVGIWIVIPLALGMMRMIRSEVKSG